MLLKGSLREMQQERQQADAGIATSYFRPTFVRRLLRDTGNTDGDYPPDTSLFPRPDHCQPPPEASVLRLDDVLATASHLRGQRCKPLLEPYSVVPYEPSFQQRWFVPESDRILTVGQLMDRVADREKDWWLR